MSTAAKISQRTAALLADAMRLSEEERGEVAIRLIESLDPATDADVDAAWSAEIQQRLEELRTGQVKSIPWTEARRMVVKEAEDRESEGCLTKAPRKRGK
jgi:putative addiction module component (TIGR02574 family)